MIHSLLLGVLLAATGCSAHRAPHASEVASPPVSIAASAIAGTVAPAAGVQHIFLLVMENRAFGDVIGNSAAPYTNSLAARYGLATRYFAVAHPSLPNYLALLAGDTFGVRSDCEDCFQRAPTLVDQIEASGRSWKGYMEDLPAACSLVANAGGYALKHDPFLYFQSIRGNPQRCRRVVPLSALDQDLSTNSVPSFAWITPNLTHDSHDSDVATGDAWLRREVPQILSSPAWQQGGLLLITWDEGTDDAGCCGGSGGGQVATLVIAPSVKPGARSDIPTNHFGLLRGIDDLWSLPPLARAATANGRWLVDLLTP